MKQTITIDSIKAASAVTGNLSKPSKMPCHGTSLPATECKVGKLLAQKPGSTCHGCYALKGNYRYSNVQAALRQRLDALTHPLWVEAMAYQINHHAAKSSGKYDGRYFRWHDSGDIQSIEHLCNIAEVARRTPEVKHWLPTREYGLLSEYVKTYGLESIPDNLTIRVSAPMVGKFPQTWIDKGFTVSYVHTGEIPENAVGCHATESHGDNKCGTCRACWNKNVTAVSYRQH